MLILPSNQSAPEHQDTTSHGLHRLHQLRPDLRLQEELRGAPGHQDVLQVGARGGGAADLAAAEG